MGTLCVTSRPSGTIFAQNVTADAANRPLFAVHNLRHAPAANYGPRNAPETTTSLGPGPEEHMAYPGTARRFDTLAAARTLNPAAKPNGNGSSKKPMNIEEIFGENTFGFEDLRADQNSDFDYNDLVMKITNA